MGVFQRPPGRYNYYQGRKVAKHRIQRSDLLSGPQPKEGLPVLNFEKKALDHILRRGGEITIFFPELRGCCVPENLLAPEVILGRPVDKRRYRREKIQEVTVHYLEGILDQQDLEIRLGGVGPFKGLFLTGWKAFPTRGMTEVRL